MKQNAFQNFFCGINFSVPPGPSHRGLAGVRTVADDLLIVGNGESLTEAVNDHDVKLEALLR